MGIIIARNIFVKTFIPAFRMTHLTKHAAIGAGNALNGKNRTVGIVTDVINRKTSNMDMNFFISIHLSN